MYRSWSLMQFNVKGNHGTYSVQNLANCSKVAEAFGNSLSKISNAFNNSTHMGKSSWGTRQFKFKSKQALCEGRLVQRELRNDYHTQNRQNNHSKPSKLPTNPPTNKKQNNQKQHQQTTNNKSIKNNTNQQSRQTMSIVRLEASSACDVSLLGSLLVGGFCLFVRSVFCVCLLALLPLRFCCEVDWLD